jgi:hypothetical protein
MLDRDPDADQMNSTDPKHCFQSTFAQQAGAQHFVTLSHSEELNF